jgi:hypothetical protein
MQTRMYFRNNCPSENTFHNEHECVAVCIDFLNTSFECLEIDYILSLHLPCLPSLLMTRD